jgi:NCS1 family nucleobase:cation symporter-1
LEGIGSSLVSQNLSVLLYFVADCFLQGANNSAWTAGSTLLALGLSVSQSMGVIVGASLIISMIAVVAGWMGSHDYLGFTVMSRASV